jgi:hypothetical protein
VNRDKAQISGAAPMCAFARHLSQLRRRFPDGLRRTHVLRAVACIVLLAGAGVAPVSAAGPARDGVIAYAVGNGEEEPYSIMTIRPDGTGNRRLLGPTRQFAGPCVPGLVQGWPPGAV